MKPLLNALAGAKQGWDGDETSQTHVENQALVRHGPARILGMV